MDARTDLGANIDAGSGLITGTLTAAGTFSVTVRAFDGEFAGETSFAWRVDPPPPPPPPASRVLGIVNPGPQLNAEGDNVEFDVELILNTAGRAGRKTEQVKKIGTFSALNLPAGLRLKDDGRIHGHIDKGAAAGSPYRVTVRFTEGSNVFSVTFDWVVTPERKSNSGRR